MTRDPFPDRSGLDALRGGLPHDRRPTTDDRLSSIEDAARLVGGERDDDTGPGYIAPPPLSLTRFDWAGWCYIGLLLVAAAVFLWMGAN